MTSAVADPLAVRTSKLHRNFWVGSLVAFAVASAVFLTFPGIDLWVSRVLYWDVIGTLKARGPWLSAVRGVFIGLFWISVCVTLVGLVVTRARRSDWLGFDFRRWLFLAICLGVGPGLVANTILKDHWGRARPKLVAEFGGNKSFTPPLVPSNQCERNCSFVGGEAAAVFVPFYAAALLVPQSAVALLAVGTLAGLAVGVVRIAQGAHFLSDIVFAGVFMALVATAVHQVMFGWSWSGLLTAMRAAPLPTPSPAPSEPGPRLASARTRPDAR